MWRLTLQPRWSQYVQHKHASSGQQSRRLGRRKLESAAAGGPKQAGRLDGTRRALKVGV